LKRIPKSRRVTKAGSRLPKGTKAARPAPKKKERAAAVPPPTWPEAEVIAQPLKEKELQEPLVLIRRRVTNLGEPYLLVRNYPTHISLFTGVGGMDLGAEQGGFVTLCQHEWWDAACKTLIDNRPHCFRHSALIQGDIRRTPTSMILGEAGLRVGETDLVTGGPPCQGFSTSGRRDPADVRNTLVFEFLRFIREAQPRFFAMENVPGFISLAKNRFLKNFLQMAHGCYYELVYGLLNAVQYGVPQDRVRFFCMGTRRDLVEIDGKLASLPKPRFFAKRDLKEIRRLGKRADGRESLRLLLHSPGIRYFPDRPLLIPPRPTSRYDGRGGGLLVSKGFQRFFERLRREQPDRIVDGPCGDERADDFGRHTTVRDAIGDLENIPLTAGN
jgi:site-specific DNA-cytosine methylase